MDPLLDVSGDSGVTAVSRAAANVLPLQHRT